MNFRIALIAFFLFLCGMTWARPTGPLFSTSRLHSGYRERLAALRILESAFFESEVPGSQSTGSSVQLRARLSHPE